MYLNALPIGSGGESRKIQERGNAFLFGEKKSAPLGDPHFSGGIVLFAPVPHSKEGRKLIPIQL